MNAMMKRVWMICFAACAAMSFAQGVAAQEHGTRDEAKAMVDAAYDHVQKVGAEKAFQDFTNDKATWNKKDLYVMAYDETGTCVGHGANGKLVGKNLIEMRDPNGKQVIKELTDTAMQKNTGWVEYDWPHPVTKKIEGKVTYVRKLANYKGFVGVGVYR